MRITMTEVYKIHDCRFWYCCDRMYCPEHRLLWRECETAITTTDGAGQKFFEMRECPECVESERRKRYERMSSLR